MGILTQSDRSSEQQTIRGCSPCLSLEPKEVDNCVLSVSGALNLILMVDESKYGGTNLLFDEILIPICRVYAFSVHNHHHLSTSAQIAASGLHTLMAKRINFCSFLNLICEPLYMFLSLIDGLSSLDP